MGKISKALEKAEKQNVTKPVRRSVDKRVRPDMKVTEPPIKAEPVAPSNPQQSLPDRAFQDRQPVEHLSNKKPTLSVDPRPTIDPSPSTGEPVEPPIPSRPTPRLEKTALHDNYHSDTNPLDPSVESRSPAKTDSNRNTDGVNISLLKPEASELPHTAQRIQRTPETGEMIAKTAAAGGATPRKAVSVRYSKTKIQINDPNKLRNNKVLSIFEDIETTNQFKILRTQVLRKLKAIGGNSILVTSANPYEGKTFTSINLGVSIAKEFDRTVLIIDADVRRPTRNHTDFSTEFFSLNVDKGLTDYLEGEADIEDILINPGIDKLTLIPGGMPVDNSPELLNSARMEEMMSEIKSRYPSDRLVIVDGPAILHFPDAMILYRYVDGVLPVIESEKTSTEDLKQMMNHLAEVNILGVVLNKNKG